MSKYSADLNPYVENGKLKMTPRERRRFWSRVDRVSSPTGCWLWTGFLRENGYGEFGFKGRNRYAHRVAYQMRRGLIPEKMFICHRCDNPACVRASHLWLGTSKDNQQDMAKKGRSAKGIRHNSRTKPECVPKGEKHWLSKVSESDIRKIRSLYQNGFRPQWMLGEKFGLTQPAISLIVRKKLWKHI